MTNEECAHSELKPDSATIPSSLKHSDDPSLIPVLKDPSPPFYAIPSYEFHRPDGYYITTDKRSIDFKVVTQYLLHEAYWKDTRTPENILEGGQNSLTFSILKRQPGGDVFCGYGRLITDYATFAYLSDIFVLERERGKGLGKWIVAAMFRHPNLHNKKMRWLLFTGDAQGLYRPFGFEEYQANNLMYRYG
ncbi:uncharacterized protein VTP21DRAFT_4375 [Calcarisporiella thermophila]|uniref:uncharacterized protein n=1 Tax=Calcarisporiella thermophila TaxID=911321 RepID=UPI0037436832